MNRKLGTLAVAALVAVLGTSGCSTNSQGDDASPVFLTINFQLLPLRKNVADGTPLQLQTVNVRSVLKAPGGATTFLDTILDDYVVEWSRLDGGRAAPGTETFGGNLVVPAGGTSTLANYQFMSPSALIKAPLDQLFPFNGGIDRETGNSEIRCKATVTMRGRTLSGQPVRGVGNFDMTFIFIPPAARAR